MFRNTRHLLALAAITTSAFAQTAQNATPAPPTLQSLPPAAAQSAPNPITTIKATAQLVVVDVVVTDSHQAPIHNLKASDFSVSENSAAQQITGFEEHTSMSPADAAKIAPMRPLPPGLFTNFTPVPPGSAVNILLLDALNTQMKDQSYVLNQLRDFLNNSPQGTRIAIFILKDHLVMLQGFTSDLTLLKSVVEKSTLGSSRHLTDSSGNHDNVGNGGTQTASQIMSSVAGGDMAELIANFQQSEAMQAAQETQDRAKMTLDAMNQLAHYLAGIPGRKNLIWFSGSFPLTIFPQSDIAHPFSVVASSEDEFRETTNLLTRAQVAIYPIDAGGLKTTATPIGNDSGPASSGKGLTMAQNKLFQDNASAHGTMFQIAADTGGQAFVDTNGLSQAVGKAIENGANYYTLSYTPTDARQNGEFRNIQVKLARQGLTMTYRNGYYADDAKDIAKHGVDSTITPEQPSSLSKAMMRGAPDATEILIKLQVLPANNSTEPEVAKGNILNPNPTAKLKIKGPYRRYAIDVAADAKDIHIAPTPDGHYQFTTELITYVYDAAGAVVNMATQRAHGNLSVSTYANMRRVGLPFHQEISVPASGEYYLRTALHDLNTDRYGAVEIPLASIAKLQPLAAAAPLAK